MGAVCALVAGRALGSMLYGVSPADPVTCVACGLVVAAANTAAAIVPAARATRMHPMVELRSD